MHTNEKQETVYQEGNKGLSFTENIYTLCQRVDKGTSDKNIVMIFLEGNGIIMVPEWDSCKAGKGKLVFIPAGTSWSIDVLRPIRTLEIQFSNLDNFYCEPYFRSLLPLCHYIKNKITTLYSCTAIEEYAERVMNILHKKQYQALTNDYELFIILGVYYPKSEVASFFSPFLETLQQ